MRLLRRIIIVLISYLSFIITTQPHPLSSQPPANHFLLPQIFENSESPSYAPVYVDCPSETDKSYTYTRPAKLGVSLDEANYIKNRQTQTATVLLNFLLSDSITDFTTNERQAILEIFNTSAPDAATRLPNTAIAFSGGGYRAMLNGASIFRALDQREANTTNSSFAGLIQGMNYMSGLSGGSWLIGSIALNDFSTVDYLRTNKWHLEYNLSTGVKGKVQNHLEAAYKYLQRIHQQVEEKKKAGFVVTITDYWALALGRQFLDKENGGTGETWRWDNLIEKGSFKERFEMPFPIVVADEREPNKLVVERNSTVFEVTPYEFGTWDREVPYFMKVAYLGTNMSDGKPAKEEVVDGDDEGCVQGFDMGNFVMGTSSSLFSGIVSRLGKKSKSNHNQSVGGHGKGIKDFFNERFNRLLSSLANRTAKGDEYIASYPNPFYNFSPETNNRSSNAHISLADGGLDNQNIPLWPLIQPTRNLDFILAVDSSADTHYRWPNGSSLVTTQTRIQNLLQQNWSMSAGIPRFPSIPSTTTEFVEKGLNLRPTFFGCDPSTYDAYTRGMNGRNGGRNKPGPLIVYLPNSPWTYYSNTSTFQLDYIQKEIDEFFENGVAQLQEQELPITCNQTASQKVNFKTCTGCALLQRAKERLGIPVGESCECCFRYYCWPENGGMRVTGIEGFNNSDPVLMSREKIGMRYHEVHGEIEEERRKEEIGEGEGGGMFLEYVYSDA